ncbi:MAG: oligosaccharide flippase family protein [Patescibacteria group bacterium]
MKDKSLLLAKKILRQELISGSVYIFIGSIFANIFNLFFNLFMSRNLAVEEYGIFTSSISLVMLIAIPVGSITPTVVSFAGSRFAKEDYGSVKALFLKITKPLLIIGVVIFFCFVIFARYIGDFFHIEDKSIIVIAGFIAAMAYIGAVNSGLLQARLAFKFISFSNFISTLSKLLIGVVLVFWGLSVKGAMLAVFISGVIPLILSFIYLRFVFLSNANNSNKLRFKNLLSYGLPSSLATLGMASLISTDILLVKHFFDPLSAGIYAGLSLVGKVIFFFTAPIGSVMFPLIVKKYARNESYNNIFKLAIALVFVPSILISIFYFLYPDISISFFIKNEIYLSASGILGLFGIFIATYSLISLFVYYFLSIKKTKVYIPVILGAISQILLIIFYHDRLFTIVVISLVISLILLAMLVIYYLKIYREYKKINKETIIIGKEGGITY